MLHLPSCCVTSIYHWLQEIMIIECGFIVFSTGRPAGSLCSEPAYGLQLWLPGLKTWGSEFCRVPQWMCSAQHPCLVTVLLRMFHCESRASLALSLERQTPRVQELVAVTHSNYCYTLKSTCRASRVLVSAISAENEAKNKAVLNLSRSVQVIIMCMVTDGTLCPQSKGFLLRVRVQRNIQRKRQKHRLADVWINDKFGRHINWCSGGKRKGGWRSLSMQSWQLLQTQVTQSQQFC